MTAKETVLQHAPRWSEEQAERALIAAEGSASIARAARIEEHRALMARAAALRARQSKPSDAAALVREGREELERRTP